MSHARHPTTRTAMVLSPIERREIETMRALPARLRHSCRAFLFAAARQLRSPEGVRAGHNGVTAERRRARTRRRS